MSGHVKAVFSNPSQNISGIPKFDIRNKKIYTFRFHLPLLIVIYKFPYKGSCSVFPIKIYVYSLDCFVLCH